MTGGGAGDFVPNNSHKKKNADLNSESVIYSDVTQSINLFKKRISQGPTQSINLFKKRISQGPTLLPVTNQNYGNTMPGTSITICSLA